MPNLTLTLSETLPDDLMVSRVTDLALGPGGGPDVLYSTTRYDGRVTAWDISSARLTQIDRDTFAIGALAGVLPGLSFVTQNGTPQLLTGGGVSGQMTLRPLNSAGQMGTAVGLGTASAFAGDFVQPISVALGNGTTAIYGGISNGAGVARLLLDSTGSVVSTGITPDTSAVFSNNISDLSHTTIGAASFVFTTSTTENGVTAWQVNASGNLTARGSVGTSQGLWINAPTALETATVAGKTYVIVAAAGSGTLSTLAVGTDGSLSVVGHMLDDLNSRFAGASALATVQHGGQTYVIAGGSDDGISVYSMLPGGGLLARAHLADSTQMTLADISAIAARSNGTGIDIFVASSTEAGLTRLRFETGPAGSVLTAGTGNSTLTGGVGADLLTGGVGHDLISAGAGDDILIDGAGSDTLTGGVGADVFVMAADGAADTITDFQLGLDRVDLGEWPLLRSVNQLFLTPTSDGIRITYGTETLTLRSADGKSIAAANLSDADLIGQARVPQVITPGYPGPVTTPPPLPDRPESQDLTPPPSPGPEGFDIFGGSRNETLRGADGNDLIWGQGGNDVLYGNEGADMLFGGSGLDTLSGGAGNDLLYGGGGRDLGWTDLNASRTENADRLLGGTGDDKLWGQAGSDYLSGGVGSDTLTGGAGRDTFVFTEGRDRITDFAPDLDRIALNNALWTGTRTAAQVIDTFATVIDGDALFDFGGGHILRIDDIAALSDLTGRIDFI